MEVDDHVLDGVVGDESVDGDGSALSDAVSAVGGLVFDSWVPPGVEDDDVVGLGEVESESAGAEADEEGVSVAVLEVFDGLLAVFGGCGAVEVLVGDVELLESGSDDVEVLDELREDEGFVSALLEVGDESFEFLEFGAGDVDARFDEERVAGGLAELLDGGEDADALLGVVVELVFVDFADEVLLEGLIEGAFLVGEIDVDGLFGLWGEFLEDLVLLASEEERLDEGVELLEGVAVWGSFDGVGEAVLEGLSGAEESWGDELEERPEFAEVVLVAMRNLALSWRAACERLAW